MSVAMRSAKCVEENSRTKGNASTATSAVASSCNGRGWGRGGPLDVPRQDGGAVGDAERHSVGAQRCHENTETPITAAKPVGCVLRFSPARSAPCHRFILLNPTGGRRVRYIGKRNHIFSPWRQGDCTEEALEVSAKGAPARAPERSVDAGEGWLLVDRPGSCATTRARRGHSGR